jgi:hypothetical protein
MACGTKCESGALRVGKSVLCCLKWKGGIESLINTIGSAVVFVFLALLIVRLLLNAYGAEHFMTWSRWLNRLLIVCGFYFAVFLVMRLVGEELLNVVGLAIFAGLAASLILKLILQAYDERGPVWLSAPLQHTIGYLTVFFLIFVIIRVIAYLDQATR